MRLIINDDLLLEKMEQSDIPELFNILQNESSVRYLPLKRHKSVQETKIFFYNLASNQQNLIWKIMFKTNNDFRMIGIIDLINVTDKSANMAYIIDPDLSGRGIGTKVVGEIVQYSFNTLKLNKIKAPVVSRNIPSQKVLLKNNFVKDQVNEKKVQFDGNDDEVFIYSITAENYSDLRQNIN